jgi:hypothetical protein
MNVMIWQCGIPGKAGVCSSSHFANFNFLFSFISDCIQSILNFIYILYLLISQLPLRFIPRLSPCVTFSAPVALPLDATRHLWTPFPIRTSIPSILFLLDLWLAVEETDDKYFVGCRQFGTVVFILSP